MADKNETFVMQDALEEYGAKDRERAEKIAKDASDALDAAKESIAADIASEATERKADIASEATERKADIDAANAAIASEAETRAADDATLQANIDAEAKTRGDDDTALQGNIDAEEAARKAADTQLSTDIATALTDAKAYADTAAGNAESAAKGYADNVSFVVDGEGKADDYKYTFVFTDASGKEYAKEIDLPLESVVVGGRYDATSKEIVLTLDNGDEIEIPVGDLVDGLASSDELDAEATARKEADETLTKAAEAAQSAADAAQETADGKLDKDTADTLYDEYGAASSLQSGITGGTITAAEATHAGSADTADTAGKLGSDNVGSGTQPIYLAMGTATATTSTVGDATHPVYLNAGTITAAANALATETYADTAASNAETAAEAYTDANSFNAISASGTRITMTRGDNSTAAADVSIDLSGYATTSDLSSYLTTTAAANTYQPIGDYATADDLASYATITAIENGTIKAGSAGSADTAGEASKVTNALTLAGVSGFSYDGSDGSEIPLAGETNGLMSAEDKKRLDILYDIVGEVGDTLESTSWETIASIARNGEAPNTWNVGDTKTVTLTTGEEITVRIIGFDHDASNSITFEMVDCLSTTYAMNGSTTNAGGWDGSAFRTTLNGTIFDTLPADLQSVIRTVSKKATAGRTSTDIVTSNDKLFLFAAAELWSASAIENSSSPNMSTYASTYTQEGEQYEYYKNLIPDQDPNNSCTNLVKHRNGSAVIWWLRSPYITGSTSFRYVYSSGYVTNGNANYSYSISFGFVV